jgi:hypothetical protein
MRDQTKRRQDGKYDFGPRCYGCNKPAGEDYFSHPMSDCPDADGINWGDAALVLCGKCADATKDITRVAEFDAYCKKVARPKSIKQSQVPQPESTEHAAVRDKP